MTTPDPAAMFRDMLGHWESMANQFGGQALKSPEAGAAMGAATNAGSQMQAAGREAMGKMLAAANMPSRAEVTSLSERMAAMDDRLARIETLLERVAGGPAIAKPSRAKPPRSKQPKTRD